MNASGSQKEEWAPGNIVRSISVFSAPEILSPWGHSLHVLSLSRVCLVATPWTVVHQAPLSMWTLQARILEWVAVPFSRGSSRPRDPTWISYISCLAGGLLPLVPPGKPIPTRAPSMARGAPDEWRPLSSSSTLSQTWKNMFSFLLSNVRPHFPGGSFAGH